jgi:hypothetical protein
MYRYEIGDFRVDKIESFINGWYKNVKAEIVPKEPTPFDRITNQIVDKLKVYFQIEFFFFFKISNN